MSRLSEIFLEALDAPVADRERLVRELCKGDSVLEMEVLDLLRRDAEADAAFLRSPVVGTRPFLKQLL